MAVSSLGNQYNPLRSSNVDSSSDSSSGNVISSDKDSDRDTGVFSDIAALVHHFAVFVEAQEIVSADSSSSTSTATTTLCTQTQTQIQIQIQIQTHTLLAMSLGAARAVSQSLCSVLRDLCELEEQEGQEGHSRQEGNSPPSLVTDMASILRFALKEREKECFKDRDCKDSTSIAAGVLGTGIASYKVRLAV